MSLDRVATKSSIAPIITKLEEKFDNRYTKKEVDSALENKISAVEGKGLSSNDYTNEEKTKLESLSNYDDTSLANRVTNIEDIINNTGATSLITPAMIDSLWESAFENGDDKQW